MRETGYMTDAEIRGKAHVMTPEMNWKTKQLPRYDWRSVGFEQDDSHPVAIVSWNDATAFAAWMNGKGDAKFWLPTEAAWEYAARGGSTAMWFWGNSTKDGCRYANAADATIMTPDRPEHIPAGFECSDGHWGTAPVGTYEPNGFGLYDMAGNLWEWCADSFDAQAYAMHSRNNPSFAGMGERRVRRGGYWGNVPGGVRSANRGGDEPAFSSSRLGFRLVRLD